LPEFFKREMYISVLWTSSKLGAIVIFVTVNAIVIFVTVDVIVIFLTEDVIVIASD